MYHCPAWWSWGWKLAVHACVPGYDLLQMVIRPNMPNAHATTALFPHPENSTRAHLGHNLVTSPAQDKPSVIRTKCAIFSNFLGRAQMCKLYTSATFNLLFKECTPRLGIKQISVKSCHQCVSAEFYVYDIIHVHFALSPLSLTLNLLLWHIIFMSSIL